MKKYAVGEGSLEVLEGREANVVHSYMRRLGKFDVSEFSDMDREAMQREMEEARRLDNEDKAEREKVLAAAKKAAATRERNEAKEKAEARGNDDSEPKSDDGEVHSGGSSSNS